MAYAGLETLFQNMGPTYAASMAGEREGTALGLDQLTAQKEREAILKAQEENRQAQIMNPLNALYRQGEVNKQGAELPGVQAKSRLEGINADIAGETKASTVGKTNSDNNLAVQGNKLKEMATRQQMANQIVSQIMAQGPVAGEAYRRQLEAQNPEVARMLGGIPTNQLQAAQAHANEWLNQQSAAYQQALMTATKSKESHLEGAKIGANATLGAARINADSRLEIAKLRDHAKGAVQDIQQQVMSGKMTFEKAATALHAAATFSPDPELKQIYEKLASDYEKLGMNAKNAGAAGKVDLQAATGLPAQKVDPVIKPALTEGTTKSGVKFKVIPPGSGG